MKVFIKSQAGCLGGILLILKRKRGKGLVAQRTADAEAKLRQQ